MESINKLEAMVAKWYKDIPHLPQSGRKWLAENVWWIALIGVILGFLGVWSIMMLLFFAGAVLTGVGGVVGAALTGVLWLGALIGFIFSAVDLILTAIAISPLKAMQKKGWTLLFVVALINIAAAIIGFLFKYNVFELVWSLLFSGVMGYFLFEIRDRFAAAKGAKKVVTAKTVEKKA